MKVLEFETSECTTCAGGGFTGHGTGYGDICDECAGSGEVIVGIKDSNSPNLDKIIKAMTEDVGDKIERYKQLLKGMKENNFSEKEISICENQLYELTKERSVQKK